MTRFYNGGGEVGLSLLKDPKRVNMVLSRFLKKISEIKASKHALETFGASVFYRKWENLKCC